VTSLKLSVVLFALNKRYSLPLESTTRNWSEIMDEFNPRKKVMFHQFILALADRCGMICLKQLIKKQKETHI